MAKVYKSTISLYGSSLEARKFKENGSKSTIKRDVQNNGSALGYLGGRLAIGTAGLFEGFGDFVAGSVYQLAGDREYAKYLHDNDVTGGWQKKLDEAYNPSRGMQIAGDIASGVGQALPSLAVGIASGGTSLVAQGVGTVGLGMAYAGRGITSAVQETGELGAKENIYGILSGASEGATEMFFGGTQKAGKALWTLTAAGKAGAGKIARNGLLKGIWSAASSEFIEEFSQEYIDTGLLRVTGVDPNASTTLREATYAGAIGGTVGLFLGGSTGSIRTANNIRRGESVRSRGLESSLLAKANYIRNDYLGKSADFSKIDSTALRTLSAAVDEYNRLDAEEKANGTRGAMLLGEMQVGAAALETEVDLRSRLTKIMDAPTEEMARYASEAAGKTITVEDLSTNRDGWAELLAVRNFTADIMSESGTEMRANMIHEKVASERFGNIRESAGFAADVEAEGSAVYRMNDGRYVIVTADSNEGQEGKYRLGFSETAVFDAERVMQRGGFSGEQISRTLSGLADDSLTYNNETQRVEERATAQENAPAGGESVVGDQVSAEGLNEAQRGGNAGESETIRRLLPEESPSSSIKEQLRAHLDEVNKMSPVTKINYTPTNKLTLREKVGEIFKKLGYKVERQGFGTIEIGEKQIRKSMNYLSTDGELAALLAVPYVLKRGIDISGHGNHKGRSFSTVTFAAPAEINGVVGNIAAVVQMVGKNNYHTHRILMPDGSEFIFNKKTDAEPRNAGVKGDEHRQGPAINSASKTSISENPKKSTTSGKKVSEEDNGSGRKALPTKRARGDKSKNEAKRQRKAEQMAAAMREGIGATENGQSGTPVPTDGEARAEMLGRGYTDAEANAARGLVKDFDLLQPQARRAIIEMMRSGKATGASRTFMRHAANLIAYWRRDLWVMCDDKIRDDGFFYVFDDGTRLITVKPKKEGRSISEALMHELGHDVWQRADAETRKALYDLAVDGAKKGEIEEIRKRYRDELDKRGDLEGLSETEMNELLDEEVAVNLLGEVLGKEEFLDRLAGGEVSVIKRFLRTLSVMKKRFTGKDKYLYRKADDLFRAFTRVMAGQTVTGMNGEKMQVSGKTKHLFAGTTAKTTDKLKLATAERMIADGVDPETARKETGWFRGYDGKWRFEIDDSKAKVAFNGKFSRDPEIRRYAELVDKVYFSATATDAEQQELTELDKKIGKRKIEPDKLGDMLQHSELFAAYPQLADMDVYFAEGAKSASYHPGFKEIAIPKELKRNPKEFKKTLLHEVEHAIQDIEGFASGSNPEMFVNTSEQSAYDQYLNTAGEIEARDASARGDMTAEQRKNTRPDIDREDVVFAENVNESLSTITNLKDTQGTNYGKAVLLDTKVFNGISTKNWWRVVKTNLADRIQKYGTAIMPVYDERGNQQMLEFAGINERNDNHPTLGELFRTQDNISKLSVIHVDEIVEVSHQSSPYYTQPTKASWIDHGGWLHRYAYVVDALKNKIYQVHFDIAKTKDGRCLLYSMRGKIKEIGDADVSSLSLERRDSHRTTDFNSSISQKSDLSTTSAKKVSENNGSKRSALPKAVKTLANVALNETDRKRVEQYNRALTEYRKQEAELKSINGELKMLRAEKKNGTLTQEQKDRMSILARRKALLKEKMQAAEHSLLKMEALKPIQSIVKRERAKAKKRGMADAKKDIDSHIESKATEKGSKASKLLRDAINHAIYLNDAVNHRKYTDGGNDVSRVLEHPAIRGFVRYFYNRTSVYGITNKTTREAVRGLLPWYTAENEVLTGNVLDELLAKSDKNTNIVFGHFDPAVRRCMEEIANGEGDIRMEEYGSLAMIIGSIRRLYESYGRVHLDGRWQDVEGLAREQYADLLAARKALVSDTDENGKYKGALKRLRTFLTQSYLYSAVTPEAVLRDLEGNTKSGVLSRLYRKVRLGEAESKRVQANILQPVAEFFAEKENRAYRRELSTKKRFEYRGEKLTAAQAVGLWETSKRKHAQERLYDLEKGGFRIAVLDEATGRVGTKKLKATAADIDALAHQFTEQDKAYIKALEESYRRSTEYKIEADRRILGYTNAIEGHYYPITTDENYFARDVTDIRDKLGYAQVVYNKSFNKNTVEGAQAWLFVEDSLKVLNRHASGIGAYSGLFEPLQNFGRVYGAKFEPTGQSVKEDAADEIFFESVVGKTSLRGYINETLWSKHGGHGTDLDGYLTKLFSDVQGIRGEESGVDRLVAKIQGAAVTASFGLNLKVIATQLASYLMAFKNLDADVLAKAIRMQPDMEAMDKYSRITFARSFDGTGAAEGGLERLSEVGRLATKGIDFTDRQVIGRLWVACQLQVEKDGGEAFGSEENMRAAGDLLDNLLLDTQTTSLKADASALGRDKNVVAKMLTMFKTESMKSFSNLYGAFSAYVDHRRYAEAGMDGYSEMLEDDKRRIGKTVTAFLMSNAWVAVVAVAFSRIRKAARGEEEEEKIAVSMIKEMGGNVADLFPVVSEISSYLMDGYDMDYMPIASINDTLSMIAKMGVLTDAEASAAEKNKYLRQSVITLGELVGLPTRNAGRIALTLTSNVSASSAYMLRDRYDTAPTYQSDLDRALASGNERLAATVLSAWFDRQKGGRAGDAVAKELMRLYVLEDGEGKKLLSLPKNIPSSLGAAQAAAFSKIYAEADGKVAALLSSAAYGKLDDAAKAKAIRACYDTEWSRAASSLGLEVTGGAEKLAAAEGADPSILAAAAGFAKAYSGEGRKAAVIQYLSSLGLSEAARAVYMAALGYKV